MQALVDAAERARRRSMLVLPHVAPLSAFAARLREQGRGSVPEFDPLDGGVAARALFLMEKPGPMTESETVRGRVGSGFVSRDNDDQTAEAIKRFMQTADLDRSRVVLWNLVPWWNGTRKLTATELRDGAAAAADLVALLPELRVIVLVGRQAALGAASLATLSCPIVVSAHPSPINRAARPTLWSSIPAQWAKVAPLIGDG